MSRADGGSGQWAEEVGRADGRKWAGLSEQMEESGQSVAEWAGLMGGSGQG